MDGWEAEPATVKIANNQTLQSYNVIACPLFMRNSYEGGQYTPEKYVDHLQKVIKKMERAIKDLKFENAQLHEAMESISKILRAKPAQEAKQ